MSHNPVCYGPGVPNLDVAPVPFVSLRNPATSDIDFPYGKIWVNRSNDTAWILTSKAAGAATWTAFGSGAVGGIITLTGDSGGAISPVAGDIDILGGAGVQVVGTAGTLTISLDGGGLAIDSFVPDAGTNPVVPSALGVVTIAGTANQITTTGGLNTLTFSIPTTLVAPGSIVSTTTIASTTTLTGGTGITATTGNIVASTGNITSTLGSVGAATTVTAGTSITATLGAITATNGNLVLGTAGNKIISTSVAANTAAAGANSFGTTTLIGGTITVSTTAVTAASIIILTRMSVGATGANDLGILSVGTIVAATSFVINSWSVTDATALQTDDVSIIGWQIIN